MDSMSFKWKAKLYKRYFLDSQGSNREWTRTYTSRRPFLDSVIRNHVPLNKDISIADLGCGSGQLIFRLNELGYQNTKGVDISINQIREAKNYGLKNVYKGDIKSFLVHQKNPFDVIFLMDILEHLDRQELFDTLQQVVKKIKPDGRIILHVPNAGGLFGMVVRYGDLTHENCFTSTSISQCLKACGFVSIRCYEDKPVVHGLLSFFRRVLWILFSFLIRILTAIETGTREQILTRNMLVVAEKKFLKEIYE